MVFCVFVSSEGIISQEEIDLYYANMQKEADLDGNQIEQIAIINRDYGEKFKELSKEEISRWKKIRKARSFSKDQKKTIQSLLTDSQYDRYLEFVESEGKKLRQAIKDKRKLSSTEESWTLKITISLWVGLRRPFFVANGVIQPYRGAIYQELYEWVC